MCRVNYLDCQVSPVRSHGSFQQRILVVVREGGVVTKEKSERCDVADFQEKEPQAKECGCL